MFYYEVAPMLIVRKDSKTFTYTSSSPLKIGTLVTIPIGKKEVHGIVIEKVTKPSYETRSIIDTIITSPLPLPLIKVAFWMSEYYAAHPSQSLQLLIPRGITKKRRSTDKPIEPFIRKRTKIVFNKDQALAVKKILTSKPGTTHLLHGVTGSGKTAVYTELAKKALDQNKSAIVLVPEIALTKQLVDEFSSRFPNVYLNHSNQTEAERHINWQKIMDDANPKIIIGPRSALFLPVANLGLIVIDEAHEPTYKQEQSPRYSALRVASVLAKEHGAKLVLGSATPSLTDYYIASKAEGAVVELPKTARQTQAPDIKIINMTDRQHFTRHRFLSDTLLKEMDQTLQSGNQALIFHNRRGSASLAMCESCGWQAVCERCYVPMSLHADKFQLQCHSCGLTEKPPTGCPTCHHDSIIYKGIGTKLIETELTKLYPKHKIARFDGDTDSKQGVDSRYKDLYDGEIDIIIGTQIVAKGLDLPNLRMVGIVQADTGLVLPDFSASERAFQLITQAIGRVGRTDHKSSVVIQSFHPNHPSIRYGASSDYQSFYSAETETRRRGHFPPHVFLLRLVCVYKTEASAIKNAKNLTKVLREKFPKSIEILGPTPAFYERQRDTYRWQLIVKSKKRADLLEILKYLPPVHWQFELDPTNLL